MIDSYAAGHGALANKNGTSAKKSFVDKSTMINADH